MTTIINKYFKYNDPKVSVIIPNYNHELFLKERIESVINQSFQDFETIILDDCSTDHSRDIIEEYKNNPHVSKLIYNETNTGSPFIQWERGINSSIGEWIWIAESDDSANIYFLETLVKEVMNNKNSVVAFSHSYLIDTHGNVIESDWDRNMGSNKPITYSSYDFIHKRIIWNCSIYNASMTIFKKSAYNSINNSFKQYRACGDWAFWLNICSKGDVIEVCKKLNYFRQHPKRTTEKAAIKGNDWKEVADILNNAVVSHNISGFELRCFRGKWMKDLEGSHTPIMNDLKKNYPNVFNGNLLDIFCYRIWKLYSHALSSI